MAVEPHKARRLSTCGDLDAAPAFTTRETSLASVASSASDILGCTKGFQIFRVKVLAAPIDMMAAGTRAPIAIAANVKPANQDGNIFKNSCGTTSCGLLTTMPAACPIRPSNPISPRTSE